jgi:hypothetical protein
VSGQANSGQPNTFLKLRARALPSETKLKSRKSLIFNPRFTQVVDFHDFCRFLQMFLMVLVAPVHGGASVPERSATAYAGH